MDVWIQTGNVKLRILVDAIDRLSIAFSANGTESKREFVPRDQVSIYLSFTVHYNYTKIGRFTPILSIIIVLNCFYPLISHFENFSTWISRLPFAVNAMPIISIISSVRFQRIRIRASVALLKISSELTDSVTDPRITSLTYYCLIFLLETLSLYRSELQEGTDDVFDWSYFLFSLL